MHEFFLARKISTILTREPGGTKSGEKIREILFDEEIDKLSATSEVLLNFTARNQHVENLIKPALQENKIVISDRFFDSTYAYQGSAYGFDFELIDQVRKIAIGDFVPDITFLIDLPVELAFERIVDREGNNRYDRLSLDFHKKVREGFLLLAKKNPRIKVLDGTRNMEEIFTEITKFFN